MPRQIDRLAAVLMGGFLLVALATAYWSFVRADDLTARGDNPRRILLERRVPRGPILDRHGAVLAEAVGPPGEVARHYPYPPLSSLLGYVSPLYGLTGLEAALDPVLHGDAGYNVLELWQMETLLGTPPPGRAIRLTLDLALQRAADEALGGRDGAVVVVDSATGEILALASHPTYDANTLEDTWEDLIADPHSPLLNRAVLGLYQPGGALAPAVLAAGLAGGVADLDEPAPDVPLTLNGRPLECAAEPPAGATLAESLAAGCPAPLASLGTALGAEALQATFTALHLYQPPAIGLPAGAAPAEVIGDPQLAALGQGTLAVTPLHMALVTAAIAQGGTLPAPRLVLEAQDRAGQWQPQPPTGSATLALPGAGAEAVAAWMAETGHTALALTSTEGQRLAWFTGFAPAGEAQVAVAVLLEGGDAAAATKIGQAVLAAAQP